MKENLSAPRVEFLKQARDPRGVYAVEYYGPAKWALKEGYVKLDGAGTRRHFITPEGEAALKRAGVTS